jgi:hypothetical protein
MGCKRIGRSVANRSWYLEFSGVQGGVQYGQRLGRALDVLMTDALRRYEPWIVLL